MTGPHQEHYGNGYAVCAALPELQTFGCAMADSTKLRPLRILIWVAWTACNCVSTELRSTVAGASGGDDDDALGDAILTAEATHF